jgi:hypothetical protein
MKTIFDKPTRDELIRRVNLISEGSPRQWGRMNTYQMLKHCILWNEMALGNTKHKRAFIGRLFGKIAMKSVLRDEKPLARNTPTIPEFRVTGNGDIESEKKKWAGTIEEYARFSNPDFVHPFFGKMAKEHIGYMAYKHIDHHLRQFSV